LYSDDDVAAELLLEQRLLPPRRAVGLPARIEADDVGEPSGGERLAARGVCRPAARAEDGHRRQGGENGESAHFDRIPSRGAVVRRTKQETASIMPSNELETLIIPPVHVNNNGTRSL